jgi:Fic family protein
MAIQVYPYNISPKIKVSLDSISRLRTKILLQPLSRMQELQLKWNNKVSKIHWSLAIAGGNLTRPQIAKVLSKKDRVVQKQNMSDFTTDELEVINYNNALEYIDYSWYVTNERVTANTIIDLYKTSSEPKLKSVPSKFKGSEADIEQFLDYLQNGSEDPVIQSAIAQIILRLISPFENFNGKITRLLSYLFLYKYGLDFRGVLVMDEYIRRDIVAYRNAVDSASTTHNFTTWLEYYTDGMATQLEKSLEIIRSPIASLGVSKNFWQLNSRQKEIVNLLENPEESITNRDVQKRFKISQITASRDLTTLTKMGLLLPRGKGRSVYYMRVV